MDLWKKYPESQWPPNIETCYILILKWGAEDDTAMYDRIPCNNKVTFSFCEYGKLVE